MVLTQEQRVRLIAGTVGVIIVAGLLLATAVDAAAQEPRLGRGRGGPGGHGAFLGVLGGRGGLGPLTRLPGVTDAQRQEIRTLLDQRREGLAMLRQQVIEARQALSASAETGQVDDSKAAELGTATSALALAQARLQADLYAVLTPEQKAELDQRRAQMRTWRESRPGGPGPR